MAQCTYTPTFSKMKICQLRLEKSAEHGEIMLVNELLLFQADYFVKEIE